MITLVSRTALLVRVDSSDRKIEKGHCGDEECEPHGMRTEKVRFRDGEAEIQTGVRPFISDARQQAAAMITWWISVEIAVATRKRRSTLSRETGQNAWPAAPSIKMDHHTAVLLSTWRGKRLDDELSATGHAKPRTIVEDSGQSSSSPIWGMGRMVHHADISRSAIPLDDNL
ncbi:hypothetical protein D6C95_03902 [Aureobasidium pullulans]|nr:hypothetical protein D6C95_03902 [Aureobasidium pullulans]